MRSIVANTLRKEFEKLFLSRYKNFSKSKEAVIPAGCRVYSFRIEDSLYVFVSLVISPKADDYSIEFGWTKERNRLPFYTFSSKACNSEEVANEFIILDEVRTSLNRFMHPTEKGDKWYVLGGDWRDFRPYNFEDYPLDKTLENLKVSLVDVMNNIDIYIIPCFNRLAEQRGLNVDFT